MLRQPVQLAARTAPGGSGALQHDGTFLHSFLPLVPLLKTHAFFDEQSVSVVHVLSSDCGVSEQADSSSVSEVCAG